MNSTGPQSPLAPETTFHPAHDWNTILDTMPPMYLTLTDIRSRSSIKANAGTALHQCTLGHPLFPASETRATYSAFLQVRDFSPREKSPGMHSRPHLAFCCRDHAVGHRSQRRAD